MKIKHIDNSFFKLSAAQAKELSIDGKLPRHGWEKRADASKLATVELEYSNRTQPAGTASKATEAWIKRTPLSWFGGNAVAGGSTWALHLYFPPDFNYQPAA